jgi:hypothetical protein
MSSRPVFVVGSPRSGTTLLYHMLLSAGHFAVFRGETHAYDVLGPRFQHFRTAQRRQQFINTWLGTRQFELSRLDAPEFTAELMNGCRSTGDFLRIFMGGIAKLQETSRWAECTPDHVSYIPAIKREIPEALIVHVIRDGRDAALSAARLGWARPLPADRSPPVLLAALSWQWSVCAGRQAGSKLGSDYHEVRFEELVREPRATLSALGAFVGQSLDYDRIKAAAVGSVSDPNTSFPADGIGFNPVGRFKTGMSESELRRVEFLIGNLLDELGYARATGGVGSDAAMLYMKRSVYNSYFSGKLWARVNTPMGRRTSLASLDTW